MARARKKAPEPGVVGRLAERGEEAITRLVEELRNNSRLTDALEKAATAKGKLDSASHAALAQLGLASADEVKALRRQVEKLEKRLAKLEGSSARKPTRASSTRKRASVSPAPGRAVGRASRGGAAGGGSAAA